MWSNAMPINPSDFVSGITNPFLPLTPGQTLVYQTPDGSETVRFQVTRETRVIEGVTCIVVHDQGFVDGVIHENTFDYFAQDTLGNVWYFGEEVQNFENGVVVNTNGSWLAGVNGATPGIVMQASPTVGQSYNQENSPGVAEDKGEIVNTTGFIDVTYGSATGVVQIHETTPLDPKLNEYKTYVAGIGQMLAISLTTGDSESLVRIEYDGTSGSDTVTGNFGVDMLRGLAGSDTLQGLGGDDVLIGGAGQDFLTGGDGRDTFDFNFTNETGKTAATRDVITDFARGQDHIDLKTIDANTHKSGNQAFHFIGQDGFHHNEGELRYKVTAAGIIVQGDVNGDGRADFSIEVDSLSALSKGDFIL
jgi:Ca2+-binding RTX toxin-like protein